MYYFLPLDFVRTEVGAPYLLSGTLDTIYNVFVALFFVFLTIVFIVKRKILDKHFVTMIICSVLSLCIVVLSKYVFGFDGYLSKPVNIKDLDFIIKKYCRK